MKSNPLFESRLFTALADEFDSGSLRDFNGREWGGIRLDDDTRDDIKRRFKTKGGKFVRSEATILSTPSRALWEVQALQDGDRGDSRVTGFFLAFRDGGTRLDRLDLRASDGEEWYPQRRYSDWYIRAYPKAGIALMVVKERDDRIPFGLLTTPRRMERLLDKMERRAPSVSDPREQFDRMSSDLEVGFISASMIRTDVKPRNETRFTENLRTLAQRELDRGSVRYRPGAKGTLIITVNVYFKEDSDDNRVSVSTQLNAENERGKIYASGMGDSDLSHRRDRAEDDLPYSSERALRDALDRLMRQVDNNLRKQKAPSVDDLRLQNFLSLIDTPTK
jgi:hypothetical protein